MVSLFSSVHKMQYDAPDVVPCTYAGRHYDFEIDSGDRRGEGGNAIVYNLKVGKRDHYCAAPAATPGAAA